MSERTELERRLVGAASEYKGAQENVAGLKDYEDYCQEVSVKGIAVFSIAMELADALRDEQRVGGRPWGGE